MSCHDVVIVPPTSGKNLVGSTLIKNKANREFFYKFYELSFSANEFTGGSGCIIEEN